MPLIRDSHSFAAGSPPASFWKPSSWDFFEFSENPGDILKGLGTFPISSNEMAALIIDFNTGALFILNVKFQIDSGTGQHQVIT